MSKEDKYQSFLEEIGRFISEKRIYTDELRLLAWGTDAGFYRLVPRIVIRSKNEQEISLIMQTAQRYKLPVTFRAAGTSLSGQAISNSILIIAGKNWEKYSLSPDHSLITLQPGIIGQRVNEILQPFGRKFAPDPASIKSAMVGGIVMNNASGMNCGTHANSDKMLVSVRIVLTDGTILDTSDQQSREEFQSSHNSFIKKIIELRDRIQGDQELTEFIRYKYSIKNVTGLNLLPFVTFKDPFDIIAHCMVGSEGTLAFLSEVTMKTEYDYPFKASAMLYFNDIKEACKAVVAMKQLKDAQGKWIVKGAELLDSKSLASVNDTTGTNLTAILTETKASTKDSLQQNIEAIKEILKDFKTYIPVHFTDIPEEYAKYWNIRSGIFPAVGGTRKLGTTCLIEDVAFHIEDLPEATADLQQLIAKHGYDDACIYGHALEGNYHFIINQSFNTKEEIARYESLMNDIKVLVVDKYKGSLKAEHGTGRNMAPYVSYEWGEKVYELMKEVKHLFDPNNLLNPGVIFNDDPQCHIKNFKPLPIANEHIDKCIECGFCEVNCLNCGLTLSSRQRIVLFREIARLQKDNNDKERLHRLLKQFQYYGNETCAGDGLCATSCPMHINTGELIHDVRKMNLPHDSLGYKTGDYVANHFGFTKMMVRGVLRVANTAHKVLGTKNMSAVTKKAHHVLNIPLWTPAMPKAFKLKKSDSDIDKSERLKVVYFPSCINQTMGLPEKSREQQAIVNKMISLLHKGGFDVIFPKKMEELCCGTIWESKGMPDIADNKSKELEAALWEASSQGKYPILCDQSPCLYRMRNVMKSLKLYEPIEFISTFLTNRLEFTKIERPIAIHITCSMRKMGLEKTMIGLAKKCADTVFVPEEIGCCGFAGDKGFTNPEVNEYALRKLRPQIENSNIQFGYSNSRTCEIGLTTNSGIIYTSLVYLIDECTQSIKNQQNMISNN